MRILGIDPSLRSTGYGVIALENKRFRAVEFGLIPNPAKLSLAECLMRIHEKLAEVVARVSIEEAAIESTIYLQNHKVAITLGAARGAALLALGQAGIRVHEYAPRRIKSAATGLGGAQKHQVVFMIRALLGLRENPPPDAADALAVAMTHAHHVIGAAPLKKESVLAP